MAITSADIATVTRSWGGTTGEGIFVAHRADLTAGLTTPGPVNVLIGNNYRSAGAAQAAVQASLPGKRISWRREDLAGDILCYIGSITNVT